MFQNHPNSEKCIIYNMWEIIGKKNKNVGLGKEKKFTSNKASLIRFLEYFTF